MTTIKDMIQKMDQIEASAKSTSSITEASLNISANAETAAEVGELLRVMQLGGVEQHVDMPMAHDAEIEMEPEGPPAPCKTCGGDHGEQGMCGGDREMMKRQLLAMDGGVEEDYANEPDEEYHSMSDQLASGDDLHKRKKQYAAAQDGDNPMAVESIKQALELALEAKKMSLAEKKKPDDDDDGVPNWADKKPGKDDHAEDEEDDD